MKTELCSSFLWLITVYYVIQGVITASVQVKVIEQNIHMVPLYCTNDAVRVVSTVFKRLNRWKKSCIL